MSSSCRICKYRNKAVTAWPSSPSQIDVCIVTLNFKTAITTARTDTFVALNTLLNDIVDNEETIHRPSAFTVWSPCLHDLHTVVIITTVSDICFTTSSPVLNVVTEYITRPPSVQHVYLDLAITSLAVASSVQHVPCELIQLRSPDTGVAAAIGKRFGWNPQRSSLSSQLQKHATATFTKPGDLIRDFRAWVEVSYTKPRSDSESTGSSSLSSSSSLSLHFGADRTPIPTPEERRQMTKVGDETLVMIFQWSSHAEAARFKDHNQKSYGANNEELQSDLWYREVGFPLEQLRRLGAVVERYTLNLRAPEPRIKNGVEAEALSAVKGRRWSRRWSVLASAVGRKAAELRI